MDAEQRNYLEAIRDEMIRVNSILDYSHEKGQRELVKLINRL